MSTGKVNIALSLLQVVDGLRVHGLTEGALLHMVPPDLVHKDKIQVKTITVPNPAALILFPKTKTLEQYRSTSLHCPSHIGGMHKTVYGHRSGSNAIFLTEVILMAPSISLSDNGCYVSGTSGRTPTSSMSA
ncbi:hypothetical protein SEVIR_2G354166v4 [Setaria viridis]